MSELDKNPLAVNSDAFYFENDKSGKLLLLGIGNYLMGDEGVGVHVVEALSKLKLPDYLDLIDGGTGGFLLLNCFESYPKIVLIDATMDGQPAGTVNLIKPRFASDFPSALSVHDVGLKDMIEAVYLMDNVPEMFLFTISIDEIKPMTVSLSNKVKQAIPAVIDQILTLAKDLQSEVV